MNDADREAANVQSGRAGRGGLSEMSGVVYGVHLQGRLPAAFRPYLLPREAEPAGAVADLEITYRVVARLPQVEAIWESAAVTPDDPFHFSLFRLPGGFGLRVDGEDRGLVRCTPQRIGIEWATAAAAAPHHFFSYVVPLWLETHGIPVLHGSAVTVAGRAVGFLGGSGSGKSVLCAELLRLGCGFIADDGLALKQGADGAWRGLPGPPGLRLWPSGLATRLGWAPERLPRVRGSGDKRWLSLPDGPGELPPRRPRWAAFYELDRRAEPGGPVRIAPCRPQEALVRLLAHGVAAAPAAALGLAAQRLELLADVAERVPLRRLSLASGSDSAAAVLAAVESDLNAM